MLSAICFNLDQSNILSCGNELSMFNPFYYVKLLQFRQNYRHKLFYLFIYFFLSDVYSVNPDHIVIDFSKWKAFTGDL